MGTRFSVLMADDDLDDQVLMQHAFEENAIPAILNFVDDGVELLKYLHNKKEENNLPSIILLDMNMPRMGGKEALKLIKEDSTLKKIPVIIFSTSDQDMDIESSYELGASGYFTKPSGYLPLVALVKGLKTYWFESVKLPHLNKV